ncbi:ImmA/IrrE family metallo-endopeptidase [Streptococcus cuniculi]|uniref:ImmA/IrrE family metallo-endopeptidase n=1 Tax=Streptococcus cuniculi TaxID=1432788 RepID=A0A4Y9JC45_9STRE|nr:ImmA/IrrE family metallo-endopeptidase [Streptococcus cuniculi]MBF0777853.1 ImmA/IrrE family metallo-endopeptidase [Streptococcus cuniculi]TFU98151.1 ImmA/IrrE family metallo-endopeptidase [Streptococcus cuniculi]
MKNGKTAVYNRIREIANSWIYKDMKLNDSKVDSYNYHSFFERQTTRLDILVMPHRLHNDLSGLAVKDKLNRSSISYQITHHRNRQNFTKCHELAHFLLEHDGYIFANQNEDTIQEIEANVFAGILLAPDIVLLGKILYHQKTFQDILVELEISKEALQIRLKQVLGYHTKLYDDEIAVIIQNYITRKAPNDIVEALKQAEETIINEYKAVPIPPIELINYLFKQQNIVTSIEVEELADKTFIENLKETYPNIEYNFYFDYGKTLYYIYQSDKITTEQAFKNAKNAHFNMIFQIKSPL